MNYDKFYFWGAMAFLVGLVFWGVAQTIPSDIERFDKWMNEKAASERRRGFYRKLLDQEFPKLSEAKKLELVDSFSPLPEAPHWLKVEFLHLEREFPFATNEDLNTQARKVLH